MTLRTERFARGDLVVWTPPSERYHWDGKYKELMSRYGAGPFEVEAIDTTLRYPYQNLVLKGPEGTTLADESGTPEVFQASWVKKAP